MLIKIVSAGIAPEADHVSVRVVDFDTGQQILALVEASTLTDADYEGIRANKTAVQSRIA